MPQETPLFFRAYQHIQSEILTGNLMAGAQISEMQIADQLGISRTPVGEAIRALASEGWVDQLPRRGTIVHRFTRQEINDLFELREALETFSAQRAAARASKAILDRLDTYCDLMRSLATHLSQSGASVLPDPELKRFLAADMAFHLLIVRTAANERIIRLAKQTQMLSRLFRMRRERHDLDVVEHAYQFHRRIVDSLLANDGVGAGTAMAEHIQASHRRTLDEFDKRLNFTDPDVVVVDDLPTDLVEELSRIEEESTHHSN